MSFLANITASFDEALSLILVGFLLRGWSHEWRLVIFDE